MTDGARRYVPVAETIETEELEGLCREICRDMVPNWDTGAGPSPGPAATTRITHRDRTEVEDRQSPRMKEVCQRRREEKNTSHESSTPHNNTVCF